MKWRLNICLLSRICVTEIPASNRVLRITRPVVLIQYRKFSTYPQRPTYSVQRALYIPTSRSLISAHSDPSFRTVSLLTLRSSIHTVQPTGSVLPSLFMYVHSFWYIVA